MQNKTGLVPLGRAVLVEPYEPEFTAMKHGRIIVPASARERMTMAEQRAIVIAVGPEVWKDESVPRAQPGDKVMISAYAGMMTESPVDGKQYRVVNDRDVFLRITEEYGVSHDAMLTKANEDGIVPARECVNA